MQSLHFRASSDITQRLISQWQVCSGEYVPRKALGKIIHANRSNVEEVLTAIREEKYPILSINEDSVEDFIAIKDQINEVLQEVFPDKSSFEM